MTPDQLHQGNLGAIRIADIVIGERHRREFGDLQGLADSIAAEGLLQPIGITADRVLVFGERRLRACRDILGRGEIEARVVNVSSIAAGEYAENEVRKDFTFSERVAIAEALKSEVANRHGGNRRGADIQEGPPSHLKGRSSDLVARQAGFDSGRHLDRATNVIRLGTPKLVSAVDRGEVSVSAAAEISKAAPADQDRLADLAEPARLDELRRRREEAARLRSDVEEQEQRTGPTAYTNFVRNNGRLPSDEEAKTLARLDMRETPSASGKRHQPVSSPSKAERERKKILDGYEDELFRTRQALQLLAMNETDPSILMHHVGIIDDSVISENIRKGRAFLNRFGREWRRRGK